MPAMSTLDLAAKWLELDRDESTREEIQSLLDKDDQRELESRLRKRIAFGTAGLRASMKAGFAHMNSLTVLQASHGLADYVLQDSTITSPSVMIGWDHRHNSKKFAHLAAAAFLSKGFQVYWFGENNLVHTPTVPFVVSYFRLTIGIMVTASHNPKNDNGYKVYWSNGSQIIPPRDAGIAACIDKVQAVDTWDTSKIKEDPNIKDVHTVGTGRYLDAIRSLIGPLPLAERPLTFSYTPLHGLGLSHMERFTWDMWHQDQKDYPDEIYGGSVLRAVEKQSYIDPDFSTLPFPNPEEKGALSLAMQSANEKGTTLIVANDPDADRFAAAQKLSDDHWHQFTGNEMGVLLASHVLNTYQGDKSNIVMLATTVSSRMLSVMAAKEGFHFRETLTGFKWLGNVAQDLKQQGFDPVFAYEEAIGYMFPSVVWDKDGIAAAMLFLIARERWRWQGKTPYQKLQELYDTYGYFADANTYLVSPSPEITSQVFASIRQLDSETNGPPKTVGQRRILRWRDLTTGFDTASKDGRPDLPVDASSQMITCELENVVFTARGSGTEPKIKLYIEGRGSSLAEAKSLADEILVALLKDWFKPEYGLRLAGS